MGVLPQSVRRLEIDVARGLCIVLVVMMHSVLGVSDDMSAYGAMADIVAFATPFRIPAFFAISGLLAARAVNAPLRTFVDRKIVHFLYFYLLWSAIQIFLKEIIGGDGSFFTACMRFIEAWIDPYGPLWFIYVLPLFYITARAALFADKRLVLFAAAVASWANVHSEWYALDAYLHYFMFFYLGCAYGRFLEQAFAFAFSRRFAVIILLAAWGVAEYGLTQTDRGNVALQASSVKTAAALEHHPIKRNRLTIKMMR